ncbi:MAG: aldose 1-epimerase family protein [Oscillospiraceae bacterium]
MAKVFGQQFTKQQLMKRVGNLGSIAGIKRLEYQSGRANGLRAYEVSNERLKFTINIDKGMDIASLFYDGMPMHFVSRPGEMNNNWYNDGPNSSRSITGGMMFTCGLSNVGPVQTLENGRTLPQHGYLRNAPAALDGARCYWDKDEYCMEVYGDIREASLFGENLVVRRTITTKLGCSSVHIHDSIENEGCASEPLMIMYHCNAGFPLLDKNSHLVIDPISTTPRDEISERGMKSEDFRVFGEPVDEYDEQVFYHRLKAVDGRCEATLVNPDRKLALNFSFDNRELPNLIQWKCRASGDYVMGIEPSNCHPEGVQKEKQSETIRMLSPGEIIETDIILTVIAGDMFDKKF